MSTAEASDTAEATEETPPPIVDIPPPPATVRDSVARLIVEILARRALADLSISAHNDNQEPPR